MRKDVDSAGVGESVVRFIAVDTTGLTVLTNSAHGQCLAVTRQRHRVTKTVASSGHLIGSLGWCIGRFHISRLAPLALCASKDIHRSGIARFVITLITIDTGGIAAFAQGAHRQSIAVIGERHAVTKAVVTNDQLVTFYVGKRLLGIAGLEIGFLLPLALLLNQYINGTGKRRAVVGLIAVHAPAAAVFAQRTYRQGGAVGRQGQRPTKPVVGLAVRRLQVTNGVQHGVGGGHFIGVHALIIGAARRYQVASIEPVLLMHGNGLVVFGALQRWAQRLKTAVAIVIFIHLVIGSVFNGIPAQVQGFGATGDNIDIRPHPCGRVARR